MEKTLRETIKNTVYTHLKDNNGLAMGQCLTAVGWVGGTLPELYEQDGMIELSMADVAGSGFVVGAALDNRRPMYIVRYQGFNWFNAAIIVNYACKSKEIWQRPCPIFIRSIAMEGAIGPVAGSSHHSLFYRMPGVKIYSPMTPNEYKQCYKEFMKDDDVYYISEHRGSYDNKQELQNCYVENADFTLFPISITRFEAEKAKYELEKLGIKINIIHQFKLKPYIITEEAEKCLKTSKYGGIVLDDDYENGIAKCISADLMLKTSKPVFVVGLEDKSAGFTADYDNLPPGKDKIISFIKNYILETSK
jgi:acetoin:2,6-dichlorophenolindophenol oxidoreductase subunit beta